MTFRLGHKESAGFRLFYYPILVCSVLEDTRVVLAREARLSQMKRYPTTLPLLVKFLTKF